MLTSISHLIQKSTQNGSDLNWNYEALKFYLKHKKLTLRSRGRQKIIQQLGWTPREYLKERSGCDKSKRNDSCDDETV